MEFICQHCDKLAEGLRYKVTSEDAGEILLDMIVCQSGSEQAKNLGLDVKEIDEAIAKSRVWRQPKC